MVWWTPNPNPKTNFNSSYSELPKFRAKTQSSSIPVWGTLGAALFSLGKECVQLACRSAYLSFSSSHGFSHNARQKGTGWVPRTLPAPLRLHLHQQFDHPTQSSVSPARAVRPVPKRAGQRRPRHSTPSSQPTPPWGTCGSHLRLKEPGSESA